ncbi:prolipoprotein diacylglyceryl transferase [Anaerotignum sp. MB30-C6]|uniref:prolipoprotein diacylglyceryl transferase n=1 Tax=Anaerotignum sp. MB30-C6 TaxID=3070814 RepID=UPI0027DC1B1F|nr:prolipoprotein diacylglyceryl transferase [Anaerotignum sp. MB30-C6]WMI80724.1 prolipoprotein diacylglyceryl transferase [Anaerotignum sp. MB30-C6]
MPEIWFPNLGIEIDHLSRVAFTIFGYDVYWYGILIGTGVFLGILLALNEAKRTGQDPDIYLDFSLYALVFSIIGARLYYVLFSWEYYSQNLGEIFATREGGLAIYGGVIGGVITAWAYCKIKKLNFWQLADTAAPSLILGQVLGRWGNFFNREAFGGFTDNLFAMRYQLSQVRWGDVSDETLRQLQVIDGVEYIQVHPTFLYESLWNLVVFILLIYMSRNKKFHGQIAGLYFLGYGLGRVWIEGLRTDQLTLGGVAVSQMLSGILIVAATLFLIWKGKQIRLSHAPGGAGGSSIEEENNDE